MLYPCNYEDKYKVDINKPVVTRFYAFCGGGSGIKIRMLSPTLDVFVSYILYKLGFKLTEQETDTKNLRLSMK